MPIHRLIVLRHAKSDWDSQARADHDRPLNERGQKEAPLVARRLVERGWIPERALSSDATRTRETWALVAPRLEEARNAPVPVEFRSELYLAGLEAIERYVAKLDAKTVLVLGHNPGWEMAITSLTGRSVSMKTAYAALLESEGEDWRTVLSASMNLVDVVTPK